MHIKVSKFTFLANSQYIAALVCTAVISLVGCSQDSALNEVDANKNSCIADQLGTLRILPSVPTCTSDSLKCRIQCQLNDGPACLGLAYSAEKHSQNKDEARKLYSRACVSGLANACTNYAAYIWVSESSNEQLECARHTFMKACDANEPFACGMVGRMMLESEKAPQYAEGRQYLEKSCERVGGFSCRVLAKHLESGKLGKYQPELIHSLLNRACEGGDPDACGKHQTASETFQ